MCRNIKTLANFEPPATEDEVRASALQFVRKLSGMNKPSRANQAVFEQAVEDVTEIARRRGRIADNQRSPAQPGRRGPQGPGARTRALRVVPAAHDAVSRGDSDFQTPILYIYVSPARARSIKPGWRKPLPVLIRVNGEPASLPWRINMMPIGGGDFYLYLGVRRRALRDAHRPARLRWRRCLGHARQRPEARAGLERAAGEHARECPPRAAALPGKVSDAGAATTSPTCASTSTTRQRTTLPRHHLRLRRRARGPASVRHGRCWRPCSPAA